MTPGRLRRPVDKGALWTNKTGKNPNVKGCTRIVRITFLGLSVAMATANKYVMYPKRLSKGFCENQLRRLSRNPKQCVDRMFRMSAAADRRTCPLFCSNKEAMEKCWKPFK
jgi:hypothetical protein